MNLRLSLACIAACFCPLAVRVDGTDISIADFEAPTYADWSVEGTAFGKQPAHGTLPNQQNVSGFEGQGCVNSYLDGDKSQGALTSPPFKLERRFINFLVGGGNHPGETCVELLVDGAVAFTASGSDDERLDWQSWDVNALKGKTARIRITDRNSGGWGHINVDSIAQSDERRAEEIVTQPEYAETYRPQFHFSPRVNWTNDPNGLVFYAGEYHLFFQHNPSGINWGNMTWGHAVSPDLIHWKQLEHALLPDKLGTIFSGSAVVDWKNTAGFAQGDEPAIVAIYTAAGGTSPQSQGNLFTQCIAFSTDHGRTFTKYEKNPVLPNIVGENRDPKVVWHAPTSRWIMALFKDGMAYALFSSPDLKSWTQLQNLSMSGCSECPDFFEIPVEGEAETKRWVLSAANGYYVVGTFDGKTFAPEGKLQRSDWGKNYYAVQTYSDIPAADGRRIQIAWMNGGSYPHMPFNQQMSFPCELKLVRLPEGLRLFRTPVREIEGLRVRSRTSTDMTVSGSQPIEAEGDLFDLATEIHPGDSTEVGLRWRGEAIAYSVKEAKLSCLGCVADLPLENGKLKLRVLIDRTTIEVFGNDGRVSLTSCFIPHGQRGLEVYATGGSARLDLVVHELKSAVR